jgi:hypothetical protein
MRQTKAKRGRPRRNSTPNEDDNILSDLDSISEPTIPKNLNISNFGPLEDDEDLNDKITPFRRGKSGDTIIDVQNPFMTSSDDERHKLAQ